MSTGTAVLAGCSGPTQSSPQVTIPSLSIDNHETISVTVTVIITDAEGEIHLWETIELEARTSETGGIVDTHEFTDEWIEPRDYQLMVKWTEENQTYSRRLADSEFVEDCAHITLKIDEEIGMMLSDEPCPDSER